MHKQVCIKVNAWVDERIAPIIEALSLIKGLESVESCEDYFPDVGFSHIRFYYGYNDLRKNWNILGIICCKLAESFRRNNVGYIWTGLNWWSNNDIPYGYIIVRPEDIGNIVKAIRELSVTVSLGECMTFRA